MRQRIAPIPAAAHSRAISPDGINCRSVHAATVPGTGPHERNHGACLDVPMT